MDEDHLTPWAASGSRNYSFQFTCDNHQQLDVFQGSTRNILPYSQEDETNVSSVMWRNETKNISIIYFEDEQDKQRYCRWAETIGETAYEPDLKFSNEALYGIGKPAGIPLKKWIGKKKLQLWEFDDFGMYKRAGCHLRAIGRWLGAAVYVVHCAGQYVGDLLNSTFVDDKAQRVSFIRRDTLNYQNMNVVDGIQRDLEQLVDFVNAALKTCPTTPNPKTDVNMFLDLYQEILNQGNGTLPTTLNDLQLMSYFLCHTPLYWDTEQRLSFCNTYWSLRQSDEWLFDYYMPYTGSTFIADSWCHNLSNLPPPFLLVYNNSNLSMFISRNHGTLMRHLLIPFHRNCMEHVNDGLADPMYSCAGIDEHLFSVFPDAIPKAYVEFFKSGRFTLKQKCDSLRYGVYGLDYSKFIKRNVD